MGKINVVSDRSTRDESCRVRNKMLVYTSAYRDSSPRYHLCGLYQTRTLPSSKIGDLVTIPCLSFLGKEDRVPGQKRW